MSWTTSIPSAVVVVAVTAVAARSQASMPQRTVAYTARSPIGANAGTEAVLWYSTIVRGGDVPWMSIGFGEVNLGRNSRVEIMSLWDNGWQVLNASSMVEAGFQSASFNGPLVLVQLHVGPQDSGVFISIDRLTIGEWEGGDGLDDLLVSLCGDDDRVASTDNRVGRLSQGCTGWRITTGACLTAGHCVESDDGVFTFGGHLDFNVPPSLPDGTTVSAHPDDQYPVNTTGVLWQNGGASQDWAVFGVLPNANTGLLPHEAYGFPFRMTELAPDVDEVIRVTGFGVDETPPGSTGDRNAQNRTNQTSTGPYAGFVEDAPGIMHRYAVDTRNANSGSPVIWESIGLTIGIHTHPGCDADGGSNRGTAFEYDPLENAVRDFVHLDSRFVDIGHPSADVLGGAGTPFWPHPSVWRALDTVPAGGVISIAAGDYTALAGNVFVAGADGRAMTLVAPVGTVRIGN
jgi:hypothetical protein